MASSPKQFFFFFLTVVFLESPTDCKETKSVNPKWNQSWIFIGRTDAKAETPILWPLAHLKRPWCCQRLKAGRKGYDRGWDGWMASPTQWTWVWVNSGSCWWTGRPGVQQSMGSQRVGHDWATGLNWKASDIEHFFKCLLAFWHLWENVYLSPLPVN